MRIRARKAKRIIYIHCILNNINKQMFRFNLHARACVCKSALFVPDFKVNDYTVPIVHTFK